MKTLLLLIAAVCVAVLPTTVAAQAGDAQANDDAQCAAQATQQTGFDPSRPPPPPAQSNPQVAGSGSRARGAAAGAAIGAMGGDAGTGAAAGAVAGGVSQRSRNRRATRQANDTMAQQQQSGQAAWQQAKASCMASRGGRRGPLGLSDQTAGPASRALRRGDSGVLQIARRASEATPGYSFPAACSIASSL
jgi:hypothetical protein